LTGVFFLIIVSQAEADFYFEVTLYVCVVYIFSLYIAGWHEKEPNNPLFNPSELLNSLVKDGKLGMKTGEGFYQHKK